MKLQYFKKLAAAMAFAVAMTALPAAPASQSQAAAAPVFKTYRKNLYENGSSNGSYTYTVQNIAKSYKVDWSLGEAGVDFASLDEITTTASGKTVSNKVTIETAGSSKAKNSTLSINAKVYNASGKLVKTIKDNVTLKIQATNVKIDTTKITDGLTSLSVGKAYDFDRKITPSNSTSKTYWSVTDSAGVDCSSQINTSGIWTPTAEGSYTITAITRNAKTAKELCRDEVTAVVGTTLSSVKQTAVDEFQAVFGTDVSKKITANSFTIKESTGLASVLPKSVAFSQDGKTVTVTTHTNFRNATDYTITCGTSSKSFKASAGQVASIAIRTSSVPVNVATAIDYALYDANGINVKKISKGSVQFTANVTNGYLTDDDKLFMTTVGSTASVTATYIEGATNYSSTRSIVCTEAKATEISKTDFTITNTAAAPNFAASDYKAKNSISVGETGYAHFRAIDSNNAQVNYTKLAYASSDENTLIVENNGKMTPIKEGTAVVSVTAFEGSAESYYTFTVSVQPKKKLTGLGLGAATVTMSNYPDAYYKKYVEVIPYDQFGNKMSLDNFAVSFSTTNSLPLASYDSSKGQVELSASGIAAGTYTLTVTATYDGISQSQNLALVVVDVPYDSTAIGYSLELDTGNKAIDISMKDGDSADGKTVYARLAKMQGGVFAGYAYFDSAFIRKDNAYYNADLTTGSYASQISIAGSNELPIILTKLSGDSNTVVKAATGTYSIVVVLNNRQYTYGLTITDEQNAPAVSVKSTTSSRTVYNALELALDCLSAPAGYDIIDCTAVGTTGSGASIPVSSGSKLHILTVTLRNQITLKTSAGVEQKVYVTHTVNVGQTLTNK